MNIINPDDIDTWLDGFVTPDDHPEVGHWLKMALKKPLRQDHINFSNPDTPPYERRFHNQFHTPLNPRASDKPPEDAPEWLRQKWDSGQTFYRFTPPDTLNPRNGVHNILLHIINTLKITPDDLPKHKSWLSPEHRDVAGQPRLLIGIKTLQDAMDISNVIKDKTTVRDIHKPVKQLDEGYSLVQVNTDMSYAYEGTRMKNCLRNDTKIDTINNINSAVLSLRDAYGNPHLNLEILNKTIYNCSGKANTIPEKYFDRIRPFLSRHNFSVGPDVSYSKMVKWDKQYYLISSIPEGYKHVPLYDLDFSKIKADLKLPKNLTAPNANILLNGDFDQLPDDISQWTCNEVHVVTRNKSGAYHSKKDKPAIRIINPKNQKTVVEKYYHNGKLSRRNKKPFYIENDQETGNVIRTYWQNKKTIEWSLAIQKEWLKTGVPNYYIRPPDGIKISRS